MFKISNWSSQLIRNPLRVALPIMTHPGIELIGRKVIDAVQQGEVHAEAIKKLNEVYPLAATTMMMDLTLEAEAFGCKIEFQENDMPHIKGTIVCSATEVQNLHVPNLHAGRMQEYLKANQLVLDTVKDLPVFAGTIGPFSLAGRLFDMSEFLMACYTDPDTVELLLENCTEFIIKYCGELKGNGSSGVIIAEPAAGLVSNDDCKQFSSKYIRQIVDAVQDDTFMVVLHNCGNRGHCTEAMLSSGANAFHFGNAIDMVQTLEYCPKDKLIMGNVDPVGIMKMLTAAEVRESVSQLLQRTSHFQNFVLSTGCDLPPHVPLANIDAFYQALAEFNNSSGKVTH